MKCVGDMTPPSTGASDPATMLSGQDAATASIIYGDDGQPMIFDEATGTFVAVDLEALNATLEVTQEIPGAEGEDKEIYGSEGRSHHSSQQSRASDSRGLEASGETTPKSSTPFVPVCVFIVSVFNFVFNFQVCIMVCGMTDSQKPKVYQYFHPVQTAVQNIQ